MTFKLLFVLVFVWLLLRLVQRERLSLDLASLTMVLIVAVLGLSFSPYWVERIALVLEFSNPAMSVVALMLVGLMALCLILAVSISDLRRRHALLVRQLAQLQTKIAQSQQPAHAPGEAGGDPATPTKAAS